MLVGTFLAVFLASLSLAVMVVVTAPLHQRWSADHAGSGVQKHHHGSPPRIGLLPILGACLLGAAFLEGAEAGSQGLHPFTLLLFCALPAALIGLLEDVTKVIRARWRLLAPMLGSSVAMGLLGATLPTLGVPGLNDLLAFWPLAACMTVLMVVGFTQAINIVDGLNGLAGGVTVLMALATAWVALTVGDQTLAQMCLILAAATAGFLLVNFPRGLMFLGDGGAYFLGFSMAVIWILLLVRNPGEVSPWCVMAIAAHPTIETIFSIVRRRFLRTRKRNATAPDRQHLHTLVFRRRTRSLMSMRLRRQVPWAMNALATAVLLGSVSLGVALAATRPESHAWNIAVLLGSFGAFLLQFRRLVRFKGMRGNPGPIWRSAESRHAAPSILSQEVR